MPFPYFHAELDQDQYGEVFNSIKTYDGLAELLHKHGSVIIGWTDNAGSHMDIMFTIQPIQAGGLQRGMKATTDLFVSVSHFGFFGFELHGNGSDPGYISEKLNLGGVNTTSIAMAELINQVRKRLV